MPEPQKRLVPALSAPNPQHRLQAALDIGIRADRRDLDALVMRGRTGLLRPRHAHLGADPPAGR